MSVAIYEQSAKPQRQNVQMQIDLVDFDLTVRSGTFTVMGIQYSLAEDESLSIQSSPDTQTLHGYLYLDQTSEEVHVLIDHIDEGDPAYDWKDNLKCLFCLFDIHVPAGATSFDQADVRLYRTIPKS